MASADFSQFVVTTANETACEISTHKVRALSLHVPAAFTHTSSNFWTSSYLADLSVFLSLICDSCPSGQRFVYSFLQIPPRGGHPCCSAMRFVVAYVRLGLSPVRARPWRAYKKARHTRVCRAQTEDKVRGITPRALLLNINTVTCRPYWMAAFIFYNSFLLLVFFDSIRHFRVFIV